MESNNSERGESPDLWEFEFDTEQPSDQDLMDTERPPAEQAWQEWSNDLPLRFSHNRSIPESIRISSDEQLLRDLQKLDESHDTWMTGRMDGKVVPASDVFHGGEVSDDGNSRSHEYLQDPDQPWMNQNSSNTVEANDDWIIHGAKSPEHYQKILLESAAYQRVERMTTLARPVQAGETNEGASVEAVTSGHGPAPRADTSSPAAEFGNGYSTPTQPAHVDDMPPVPTNQLESPDDLLMRLSNEFDPIVEDGWDTVVYIGPPPREPGQDEFVYGFVCQRFSKPHLMRSQTLKNLGSESEFERLLGPKSARTERKLKKLGVHHSLPSGQSAKYYIDLRPMQNEEDALLLIAELTCSPGILTWCKSAREIFGVNRLLVEGTDDLNVTSRPFERSYPDLDDGWPSGDPCNDTNSKPKHKEPAPQSDYSALRHHMAIERVLNAIVGRDPKLNSAPKMWTFYAVAKFFGCATHPSVKGRVWAWLFSDRNAAFIQRNPEVAYRIAIGTQSPDLARTTFALLTGEKALIQAGKPAIHASGRVLNPLQPRSACHLDDDEVNRIDHAAQKLGQKIRIAFKDISMLPLSWMVRSVETLKLFGLEPVAGHFDPTHEIVVRHFLRKTCDLLREYVQNQILKTLLQQLGPMHVPLANQYAAEEVNGSKRHRITNDIVLQYNQLGLAKRPFTALFWLTLTAMGLNQQYTKDIDEWQQYESDGMDELVPGFETWYASPDVSATRMSLQNRIDLINQMLSLDQIFWTGVGLRNIQAWMTCGLSWLEVVQAAYTNYTQRASQREDSVNEGSTCVSDATETARAAESMYRTKMAAFSGRTRHEFSTPDSDASFLDPPLRWTFNNRIDLKVILEELTCELRKKIQDEILTPGFLKEQVGIEIEIPISEATTVLCLGDDEYKYMPLWAGGNDDGSGGVFNDAEVPPMQGDQAFRGGKLDLEEGLGGLTEIEFGEGSLAGGSEYDEIMTDEGVSTIGKASRFATDGSKTVSAATVMSMDE